MAVRLRAFFRPAKTSFKREAVYDSVLLIENYSRRRFFTFRNSKITVFELETLIILRKQKWKYSLLVFPNTIKRIFIATPKHKHIFLSRVTVTIHIEKYLSRFHSLIKHIFSRYNFRHTAGLGVDKLPVQILANERASVITNDDPIRIQHRHNFKNKCVSEIRSNCII